jgi:uncharacterized protein YbaA (DUF1428 family)
MPKYVDGFVIPIARDQIPAYRKLAKLAAKVWMEHGALEYRECVGEDLDLPYGKPFPKTIKLKPNETVVFSWITYKSRKHRDKVNALVMSDPRLAAHMDPAYMPFDLKRMTTGGFTVLVEA